MEEIETADWERRFEEYLSAQGLRRTRQRRAIATTFFTAEGHPNIEDLYDAVREDNPRIGQATVYRTLKLLVDSGLASASRFGGATTRYEPQFDDDDHHDHIVCLDCGRIIEFYNAAIERLQDEVASAHRFRLADHKMELYGHCTDESCEHRPPRRR